MLLDLSVLTGRSLIALMLGRLRMSTLEALSSYNKLAEGIFCKANQKSSGKDGTFKATVLEKKVQEIVALRGLGEHMLPINEHDQGLARCFVCAVPALNMDHPRLFRSYPVRENASMNCKIWEAARATTAAPTFFKRMKICDEGGAQEDFLDGGLGFNNPSKQVLDEALAIFGTDSKLGCLISLGTGHPDVIRLDRPDAFQKFLPIDLIKTLKKIATNSEQIAHQVAKQFQHSSNLYFRLNVSHGLSNISLEEWKKMNEVQTHTKSYLSGVEVSRAIDNVVSNIAKSKNVDASKPLLQSIC